MILKRFSRKAERPERRLYAAIVAAARHEVPYAKWRVADTLDGRFDMIVLHMFLVLERLKGSAEPLRQKLVDEFFADMDHSLRELGVGDVSVPKRVRKMAELFYGRLKAYDQAIGKAPENLEGALARTIRWDDDERPTVSRLAKYLIVARQALASQSIERIIAGEVNFPEPAP